MLCNNSLSGKFALKKGTRITNTLTEMKKEIESNTYFLLEINSSCLKGIYSKAQCKALG
jgi:hypothetical protein